MVTDKRIKTTWISDFFDLEPKKKPLSIKQPEPKSKIEYSFYDRNRTWRKFHFDQSHWFIVRLQLESLGKPLQFLTKLIEFKCLRYGEILFSELPSIILQ